jgi:hypothetical protein
VTGSDSVEACSLRLRRNCDVAPASTAIGSPASHKLQSFIHYRTLLPRHKSLPVTGRKCHPCVRYNVLPMSQAAHCSWS